MPRPEARTLHALSVLAVAGSLLFAVGCNRLTFVKPSFERGDFERTAPEVEISDSGRRGGAGSAQRHLLLASEWLARGNIPQAAEEASAALKLDPRSVGAHTVLAVAAEYSGRSAEAGDHYLRAVELSSNGGDQLINYGSWLCRQERAAESLAWFDRALATPAYPTPAVALANAGACADQAGQPARAERDLRRAIELDPRNAVALGALAEHELRAGRTLQARAFSERRLAAAPADKRALQIASQIEEKLGDRGAAERYVQRITAEFPEERGSSAGGDGK